MQILCKYNIFMPVPVTLAATYADKGPCEYFGPTRNPPTQNTAISRPFACNTRVQIKL